jgi:hypothetical protein
MSEKRSPEPGAQPVRDEARHDRDASQERIGPLAVERLRKDDGRSLIVYRRVTG